jgi:hypothetical protein
MNGIPINVSLPDIHPTSREISIPPAATERAAVVLQFSA